MSTVRKVLLAVVLAIFLAVIILTWGSIGSVVLTLALLLATGIILLQKFMDTHNPDDFRMEQ